MCRVDTYFCSQDSIVVGLKSTCGSGGLRLGEQMLNLEAFKQPNLPSAELARTGETALGVFLGPLVLFFWVFCAGLVWFC